MNRWVVRIFGLVLVLVLLVVLISIQNQLRQLAASRKPAATATTNP